jgi:hypothetical protein
MRIALAVLLVASTVHADPPKPVADARVELAELSTHFGDYGGKIIKIPGPLDVKPTTSFACGYDKSKYVAIDLDDRGSHLIAYCKIGRHPLGCVAHFDKPTQIMKAVVAMPKKPSGCKEHAVELLDF